MSILLVNALVQGEGAADSLRNAVIGLNRYNTRLDQRQKIDVMIIGRGGGSAEDLWAFNDEALARALRASEIPVISAVGHEIDWTISDLICDLRAATPSAAAEIVAAREEDILAGLQACGDRLYELIDYKVSVLDDRATDGLAGLHAAFGARVQSAKDRFSEVAARFSPASANEKVGSFKNRLALSDERRVNAMNGLLAHRSEILNVQMAKLDTLSPLSTLTRGYSITQDDNGNVVRDASKLNAGDKLKIRLQNGKLSAEVLSTE